MCVDRATAPTRIVLPNYVPTDVVATCSRWRVRRDTREEGKERKESHSCRLCTSNRTDEYVRHATVAPPAMDPPGITALVSHECPWTTQPVRTSAVAAYSQLLDSAVPRATRFSFSVRWRSFGTDANEDGWCPACFDARNVINGHGVNSGFRFVREPHQCLPSLIGQTRSTLALEPRRQRVARFDCPSTSLLFRLSPLGTC